MKEIFGWDKAPREIVERYIDKCRLFSESDSAFSNFRQDKDYTKVLEGGPIIIGEKHLKHIIELYGIESIKKNLTEFKENDIYGNPTIDKFPEVGNICRYTLLYISNALDIKRMMGDFLPKKIVEIGGGYGALCKILSVFYYFEEYILIDIPEVLGLCKKYLNNFPKIKDKITYVTCEEAQKKQKIGDIDLFIAIASLAECNFNTQMSYINIMLKSNFGFIVYNTEHISGSMNEMNRILKKTDYIFNQKISQHVFDEKLLQFSRR